MELHQSPEQSDNNNKQTNDEDEIKEKHSQ